MKEHRANTKVHLKNTGVWRIDDAYGKWMCLLVLDVPILDAKVVDVPTHDFCKEYLDKMLEAEWRNDNFVFANGKYGSNSKRPPQLKKKINEIETILNKWREKN